jgi:peroxisomal 3,2-trans-enoyl-CoA isomerase
MAAPGSESVITVEYLGRVAVLTIDNQKKLNAMSQMQYYDLSQKLREIATHDEVFVTVLLAKGRYFSA